MWEKQVTVAGGVIKQMCGGLCFVTATAHPVRVRIHALFPLWVWVGEPPCVWEAEIKQRVSGYETLVACAVSGLC